jgi:hypothetical protein
MLGIKEASKPTGGLPDGTIHRLGDGFEADINKI